MRILITGASSGFGMLAVPLLLERGHEVIAGLRGGDARLASVFPTETARYRGKLTAVDLHMERPETFAAAEGLEIDVLVNNAGLGLFGALEDTAPEQIRYLFEVNVFGPLLLTRKLLPMLRKRRGRVINMSSVAGLATFPGYTFYCSSKHAIDAASEGLYYELRPHGVQVALIEPGSFHTGFTKALMVGEGSTNPASPYSARTQKFINYIRDTAADRGDDPMKVARLIVSLCERKKIPLRNVIGRDAYGVVAWGRHLPLSWQVAIKIFVFRRKIYKD